MNESLHERIYVVKGWNAKMDNWKPAKFLGTVFLKSDDVINVDDNRPVGRIKEIHEDGSVTLHDENETCSSDVCENEIMQALLDAKQRILNAVATLEQRQRGRGFESLWIIPQILELKGVVEMHLDQLGERLK